MAFLPGWKQFVDITIPDTLIDEDLTQPAILVKISASCGIGSKDASFIFSELGDNSLKIAFTEAGLTDEKYAEVESWSSGDVEAYVWVSKSDLVLDADGNPAYVLRMYFDNDHADNTTYIGVSGSAGRDGPRENVWDANSKMVQHMDDVTTSSIYDSTSNDNDGTKQAANEPIEAAGKIGRAQAFDGIDDYITVANAASLNFGTGDFSVEMWIKTAGNQDYIIASGPGGANEEWWGLQIYTDGRVLSYIDDGTTTVFDDTETGQIINDDEWHHVAVSWDRSGNVTLYIDGSLDDSIDITSVGDITNDDDYLIGDRLPGSYSPFSGPMDEVRISNTIRSAAQIKANYNFQIDNMLSWGDRIQVPLLRHGFVNFQEGVF